jgi:hypothetical protein
LEQLLEGAVIAALGVVHAAMEAGQEFLAVEVGAGGIDEVFLGAPGLHAVFPDLGLGFAEAAELPLGGYHGIDEEALLWGGGLKALVLVKDEGFEDVGVLARDDVGTGVNAGFQGIEAGNGLALIGAGAGGVLGVAAVSLNLKDSRHTFRFEGSRRGGGWRAVLDGK